MKKPADWRALRQAVMRERRALILVVAHRVERAAGSGRTGWRIGRTVRRRRILRCRLLITGGLLIVLLLVADRLRRLRRNGGDRTKAVLLINIVAELHDAFRRRPGGDVDPIDRHRLRELGVDTLSGADRLVDLVARPAGRLL